MSHSIESGRSMVEMLAVLAIVGVLSIGSFAALRIAWAKAKANAIIHDGRLVFMESATSNEQGPKDWTDATFAKESGKDFQMKRDVKGNHFVKVAGVEQRVCDQMILMQKEGELVFLKMIVGEDMTTYNSFTTCEDENEMVMAFDGLGIPADCNITKDCEDAGNANAYCDTEGHCVTCDPALSQVNEAGDECQCKDAVALTCDDGNGNTWCCGDGLICDQTLKRCAPAPADHQCSYQITLDQQIQSTCNYDVTVLTTPDDILLTENDGCDFGMYCYLKWTDQYCRYQISRGTPSKVYGIWMYY